MPRRVDHGEQRREITDALARITVRGGSRPPRSARWPLRRGCRSTSSSTTSAPRTNCCCAAPRGRARRAAVPGGPARGRRGRSAARPSGPGSRVPPRDAESRESTLLFVAFFVAALTKPDPVPARGPRGARPAARLPRRPDPPGPAAGEVALASTPGPRGHHPGDSWPQAWARASSGHPLARRGGRPRRLRPRPAIRAVTQGLSPPPSSRPMAWACASLPAVACTTAGSAGVDLGLDRAAGPGGGRRSGPRPVRAAQHPQRHPADVLQVAGPHRAQAVPVEVDQPRPPRPTTTVPQGDTAPAGQVDHRAVEVALPLQRARRPGPPAGRTARRRPWCPRPAPGRSRPRPSASRR